MNVSLSGFHFPQRVSWNYTQLFLIHIFLSLIATPNLSDRSLWDCHIGMDEFEHHIGASTYDHVRDDVGKWTHKKRGLVNKKKGRRNT